MYKLKATKASDTVFALVAYNDEMQEFYQISEENTRTLSKIVHLALENQLEEHYSWVDNSYGVEQPDGATNVYAVSVRISETVVRSYILNKRRLTEFRTSLLSALDG
jgi:hypothetical protein